jgi:Na+/H+-translocating membrane pyrophosphatase
MITASVDSTAPAPSLSRDDKVMRATVVAAMIVLVAAPSILMLSALPRPFLLSAIAIVTGIIGTAGFIVFTAEDHQRAVTRGLIAAGVILLAFPIPMAAGASAPAPAFVEAAMRYEALISLAVFSVSVGASCLALGLVMAHREVPGQPAT